MGVYIKGIEMPKSCSRCALFDEGSNGDPDWCNVMHQVPEYETCPLIEIPPHGRLIDAGEFLKRAIGTKCFRGDYALMLEELVGESATIIPEEDGET